ncbi:MAG: MoaD/ThiS family protein [Saprospiraceae bacterium]|nr:MoaD/ThiS family protein [Saprospiraceae bacterium]
MKITILAFGIAKDILGARQTTLEIVEPTTAGSIKSTLMEKYPDFIKLKSLALAVNQEYVDDDTLVKDNDELVIIPPVSGG